MPDPERRSRQRAGPEAAASRVPPLQLFWYGTGRVAVAGRGDWAMRLLVDGLSRGRRETLLGAVCAGAAIRSTDAQHHTVLAPPPCCSVSSKRATTAAEPIWWLQVSM